MNRPLFLMGFSVVVLVGLVFLLSRPEERNPRPQRPDDESSATAETPRLEPLLLLCAASNRHVVEAIRADYEAEFGERIRIEYGPSQTLISGHEVARVGDLFLPADDFYIDLAQQKNLVDEVLPLARMHAVAAVAKGNARGINTLADLQADGLKVAQANPDAAAIGKLLRDQLSATGKWEALLAHTAVMRTTVTEVANDVKVGAADVGIVWDAVLATYPDLEAVALPELKDVVASIPVAILKSTKQPQRALHFARYLAAENKGLARYREFGFQTQKGDRWTDVPELKLFAGAMLRPAIEATIIEFEKREGVRVNRIYNGCGVLVAQMRASGAPDAYFACDREFMNQVQDLFPASSELTENELVILVQKGNPKGITSLKDLTKPGVRVGIGHEKQCAMGWLTQQVLQEGKLKSEVMQNVTVQSPTGDMLVNQMRTGSLDAAVAYLSNAAGSAEALDAVRIKDIKCVVATQPFAIGKQTDQPQLARRLFERLRAADSRERFLNEGFRWTAPSPLAPGKSSSR